MAMLGCLRVHLPFTEGFVVGFKEGFNVGAASESRTLSASTRKNTVMIMFLPICNKRKKRQLQEKIIQISLPVGQGRTEVTGTTIISDHIFVCCIMRNYIV